MVEAARSERPAADHHDTGAHRRSRPSDDDPPAFAGGEVDRVHHLLDRRADAYYVNRAKRTHGKHAAGDVDGQAEPV